MIYLSRHWAIKFYYAVKQATALNQCSWFNCLFLSSKWSSNCSMCLCRYRSKWFLKYLFYCCFFICIVRWRTSSIKPSWRVFLRANTGWYSPQIENSRLHNKAKKILEGFQGGVQPLCMSRVLGMAHKIIQHFGQLPVKRQGKPRQLQHTCK